MEVVRWRAGQLVATVIRGNFERGVVRVSGLPDGRPVCELPWEDTIAGRALEFTPDGSRLMVLAPRGVVKFYDPRTGKLLAESKPVVEKDDVRMAFSTHRYSNTQHQLVGGGQWVMTSLLDNTKATLTEVTTAPAARPRQVELERPAGRFEFWHFRFIYDGTSLLNVGYEQASEWKPLIRRWDVRTG